MNFGARVSRRNHLKKERLLLGRSFSILRIVKTWLTLLILNCAVLAMVFLCSCGYSHSDPCQSSIYEECMRRTEDTLLADIVCSEKAVSECED